MRLSFFILVILLVGCSIPKKAEHYVFSRYSSKPVKELVSNQKMTNSDSSRVLEVLQSEEFPVLAQLKGLENLPVNEKISDEHFGLDKKEVKHRIEALKNQLYQLEDYQVPTDTLINEFDENYQKAKKQGIWAFVLSLAATLSLVALPPLFLPFFLGSNVLAFLSLGKFKRSFNKRFKALPIIALVINGAWLVLFLIAIMVLIAWASSGSW